MKNSQRWQSLATVLSWRLRKLGISSAFLFSRNEKQITEVISSIFHAGAAAVPYDENTFTICSVYTCHRIPVSTRELELDGINRCMVSLCDTHINDDFVEIDGELIPM